MDTDVVQPVQASHFYGSQKQPRPKFEIKRRSSRSCAWSPALLKNGPFSASDGHSNLFLKRQHSPACSDMSNALKDVQNTSGYELTASPATSRAGTPLRPAATRTWQEARSAAACPSVEKKIKAFHLRSAESKRSPTASKDVCPARQGYRKVYSKWSGGQQSALAPRDLFSSKNSDCENRNPQQNRTALSVAKKRSASPGNNDYVRPYLSGDRSNTPAGMSAEEDKQQGDEKESDGAPESQPEAEVVELGNQQQEIERLATKRPKSVRRPIPLMNLKNSCYMNSVVQSLAVFPDFTKSLQNYLSAETNPEVHGTLKLTQFPITASLVKLFMDYEAERTRRDDEDRADIRYRLETLKQRVGDQSKQFLSDNQQDAGEFFSFLMDSASDEMKKAKTAVLVDDWMAVTTVSRMTCLSCRHASEPVTTHSTSTYLAVPENPDDSVDLSLQMLLTASLQEVERRECRCSQEGCKGREAAATRTITKLPKILVIQMSRISPTGQKLETPVELSPVLRFSAPNAPAEEDELTSVVDGKFVSYTLRSVICHVGPSITKGHYYSMTRNHVDDKWYDCDDHEIKQADFDQVRADSRVYGYCFFYDRQD